MEASKELSHPTNPEVTPSVIGVPCPGMPVIPWRDWHRVLQVYIDAAAKDAMLVHKKALLLNVLGVEGVRIYFAAVEEQTQAGADGGTSDAEAVDVFQEVLAVLGRCFAPEEDEVVTRLQFKRRTQGTEESTTTFPKDLQRLAKTCGFGTATDAMFTDHILADYCQTRYAADLFRWVTSFHFKSLWILQGKKNALTN
ncbi:hypothetical protein HPB49_018381 [Dermacentor silvarum]|uniref:Uncharacterized protein n=1 Tax=Dermacentor silvarum TaxID=543639 RepID=A0ACB8E2Z9_DERSI|nr:hypothetical protein HPB49_018381 [Dermacentor silvarum]